MSRAGVEAGKRMVTARAIDVGLGWISAKPNAEEVALPGPTATVGSEA